MKLRKLFNDDDAVSPVIGVILMVAITVILAAVIATFVLGLGEQVSDTAPQASFNSEFNEDTTTSNTDDFGVTNGDGNVTVTHAGGATIDADQLYLSGSSASGHSGKIAWSGNVNNSPYGSSSQISSGDSVDYSVAYGDTVTITWQNEQNTDSATLTTYDVPNNN